MDRVNDLSKREVEYLLAENAHPCRCVEPKPATEMYTRFGNMFSSYRESPIHVCSRCGFRQGRCARTACSSKVPTHWNWSTRLYYCADCAKKINEANGEEVCLAPRKS